MRKITVIFFSIVLITIAVLASLAVPFYASMKYSENLERDKLFSIAKVTINRTRRCLDQGYDILAIMNKDPSIPCSEEHIKKMQRLVFSKIYLDDMEYIEGNQIKCGAFDIEENNQITLPAVSYELSNGVGIIFNVPESLTHGKNYVLLKDKNYSTLIYQDRFTDIMIDPYVNIAIVLNNGKLLSSLNAPDQNLIREALNNPKIKETKNELVAVSKVPDITVIVAESLSYVKRLWRRQLMIFMPFGLIMAAIATGFIIYFSRRRLSVIGEIETAIRKKEFKVFYQPLIDLKTGACIGAEALLRWRRPDGTNVRPDFFIPFAEETGLIYPITDQVIETVVNDLRKYFIADRNLHVAINISPQDFNSGRIIQKLEDYLSGTDIERHQIWLEITERGFMNIAASREKIAKARQLGYTLVMDDFGTGYSSLSYLKNLPINVLKIDKSFTKSVTTDSVTSNVTHYIIEMAKSLYLKIVAEGVETAPQAKYLEDHKVDFAQGWLYAKAMPIDEFIIFYRTTK